MSKNTQISWNEVANKYELFIHERYILLPALLNLFKNIKIKNKTVLDVGCGIGIYSYILANQFNCNVIGVDISTKMIEIAKKNRNFKKINFQVGDSRKLSFKEGIFDAIIMNTLLPNFGLKKDIQKSLSEANRMLKKNGKLIVSIPNPCFENITFPRRRARTFLKKYNYFSDGISYLLKLYKESGEFVEVTNYHWTLETYLQALIDSNFLIEEIIEPKPIKQFKKENSYPVYMVIIASKN